MNKYSSVLETENRMAAIIEELVEIVESKNKSGDDIQKRISILNNEYDLLIVKRNEIRKQLDNNPVFLKDDEFSESLISENV